MESKVVTHAYPYAIAGASYDEGPTASPYLRDLFGFSSPAREDIYVSRLEVRCVDNRPAATVQHYVELYEMQEEYDGAPTQRLIARIAARNEEIVLPLASGVTRTVVTLPPFVMRRKCQYYLRPAYVDAFTNVRAATGWTASRQFVLEMEYDTRPIDFGSLPPYRALVPIWAWSGVHVDSTGGITDVILDFYLDDGPYEVVQLAGGGAGATMVEVYMGGTQVEHRVFRRTSTSMHPGADFPALVDGTLHIRVQELAALGTARARVVVRLTPVLP